MKTKSHYCYWMLVAALFLAFPCLARAHAFLDHAQPKVGATMDASPTEVKIWFSQSVEPAFSSIQVQDAQGKQWDKNDTHVDDKDKSLLVVSVPTLPPGVYTVTWRVVSVDTHRTQGHFEFTVK